MCIVCVFRRDSRWGQKLNLDCRYLKVRTKVNMWLSDPVAHRVFCAAKHVVSLTVLSKNIQTITL